MLSVFITRGDWSGWISQAITPQHATVLQTWACWSQRQKQETQAAVEIRLQIKFNLILFQSSLTSDFNLSCQEFLWLEKSLNFDVLFDLMFYNFQGGPNWTTCSELQLWHLKEINFPAFIPFQTFTLLKRLYNRRRFSRQCTSSKQNKRRMHPIKYVGIFHGSAWKKLLEMINQRYFVEQRSGTNNLPSTGGLACWTEIVGHRFYHVVNVLVGKNQTIKWLFKFVIL